MRRSRVHALTWARALQGDKNAADQAAVDMMRKVLSTVQMSGIVVIGEGEKDVRAHAPPCMQAQPLVAPSLGCCLMR